MDRLDVQQAQAQEAQGAQDLLSHFYAQGQLRKNEKGEWELVKEAGDSGFQQAKVRKPKQ